MQYLYLDSRNDNLDAYIGEHLYLLVVAVVEEIPRPPGTLVTECAGLLLHRENTDRPVFRRIGIVPVPYAASTNDWNVWRRHGIKQLTPNARLNLFSSCVGLKNGQTRSWAFNS